MFFLSSKKEKGEGGRDDAGRKKNPALESFCFQNKLSRQSPLLPSPTQEEQETPMCLPRTRGISHQITPSVTWHIRPTHALVFPWASVKACDRERKQQIPSEDGLSTSPTSSTDENPHLWAIRLRKNKTQEHQGLNILAHLATPGAHFFHGRDMHSWHKHTNAAFSTTRVTGFKASWHSQQLSRLAVEFRTAS